VKKNLVLTTSLTLLLGGCGYVQVALETFPPGASLIDLKNNKTLGTSPLYGEVSHSQIDGGKGLNCSQEANIKAVWVSGATAILENPTICKTDKEKKFMIYRPTDAPNLDADLKYAQTIQSQNVELLKARAMKKQADAIEESNLQQGLQNMNQNMNNIMLNNQLMQINNKLR
jgi:hypothetical protein